MTAEAAPDVCIVDDDAAIRESLTLVLEVNGFSVAVFESAEDFLNSDVATTAGCLVLDARMPGMSGLELLDQLSDDGIKVPVFLITGHGDAALRETAIEKGVLECFQKPFDSKLLVERIRSVMSS